MKKIKIEIELTESEWCELVNAVGSKYRQVLDGKYDDEGIEGLPDTEVKSKEWAEELLGIHDKLVGLLDKEGITY